MSSLAEIDPELLSAIQAYCRNLEARMIKRCIKGEGEYSGQWKSMTPWQLIHEMNEELDDACVYEAMREWNENKGRNSWQGP